MTAVAPMATCVLVLFLPLGVATRRRTWSWPVGLLYALSAMLLAVWTVRGLPLNDGAPRHPEMFPATRWVIAAALATVATCVALLLTPPRPAAGGSS